MTQHKIYVSCDSSAVSLGANETVEAIIEEAKNRKIDIKIIRNGSRGMLWLEPLVEVEGKEGRIGYGPINAKEVKDLFDSDFLSGKSNLKKIGVIEKTEWYKKQNRLIFKRCGITEPLSLSDYLSHGGFKGLKKALALTPEETVKIVLDSGLRGRGGAGFPTGIKWQTVLSTKAQQKYICCNADEGDSGTFADRMIMEGDPFLLLEGMMIAGLAVGANKGYIYIRSEYPKAIKTLEKAIEIAIENNWLGNDIQKSNFSFHIEVREGAGAYICGEETAMLESIEGKRGMVRAKPPLPALEGLFGMPTIINNVLTLTSVPIILSEGASFYKNFGSGRSRGTQPFQLAGNIKHPGLVELAFGVSIKELVEDYGSGTANDRPIKAVQVGGPLGAYLPYKMLDIAADYEVMSDAGALLGHGGVVVFDDRVKMDRQARFAMKFCADESCGKCTPCRIGAVRGLEILNNVVNGEKTKENMDLLEDLCTTMTDGSLCAMGGLTPLPVRSAMRHFPEDFKSTK
jgi:formate dehydrogenase iron-sulfur subunit